MAIRLRFFVLADTFGTQVQNTVHEHLERIQECHALLLLGDLPAKTYPILREEWNLKVPGFCVLGNHDGADWETWLPRYSFEHLHRKLSSLKIDGHEFTFGGFSGSERYKPGAHWQWDEKEAARMLKKLPPCDILMCHTAAAHPDSHRDDRIHRGLPAIGKYIERHQPYLALHGHFHRNYLRSQGETQVFGCNGALFLTCDIGDGTCTAEVEPIAPIF